MTLMMMAHPFQGCAANCAYLGGPCGLAELVDGHGDLLRDLQVGNAGVPQVLARRQAERRRQQEADPKDDYDSDDGFVASSVKDKWYPFDTAAKQVSCLRYA